MNSIRRASITFGLVIQALFMGSCHNAEEVAVIAHGESKQDLAKNDIAEFGTALSLYRLKTLKYPDSLQDLTKPIEGQKEAFLPDGIPKDPWGNDYDYHKRENGYLLRSFGADGVEGGEGENADLTNK